MPGLCPKCGVVRPEPEVCDHSDLEPGWLCFKCGIVMPTPPPPDHDIDALLEQMYDDSFNHDTDCDKPACTSTPMRVEETPIYRAKNEGLIVCDYCGNIWDGCAQCLCANDMIDIDTPVYCNPLLHLDSSEMFASWQSDSFRLECLLFDYEADFIHQLWNAMCLCLYNSEWIMPNYDTCVAFLKTHFKLHEKIYDLAPNKRYCTLVQLIARLRKSKERFSFIDLMNAAH